MHAETRDRTGDLQIFSLTLSQLSYRGSCEFWQLQRHCIYAKQSGNTAARCCATSEAELHCLARTQLLEV